MDSIDWLPSITTTLLLAGALWLGRNLIATRLRKSVEHEFNTKLESVRADLRSKETEIAALRGGALNAMASRQIALDKRRLDAVDQLWSAVTTLGRAKGISAFMAIMNFEAVAKATAIGSPERAKMLPMFEAIGAGIDIKQFDFSNSEKARPFVSAMAWALFKAYGAILMQAVAKLHLIKSGVGDKEFLDKDLVSKLVKAALPDQAAYIDKYGDAGLPNLVEMLEEKLLDELRKMLAGEEADRASVEQAATINRRAAEVMESTRQKGVLPDNAVEAPPENGRP